MRKSPLILVADDEPMVAHTLVEILEVEGFEAISVSDGAAAVRWAREGRPNIVICDVIMPSLNGLDAAVQIKELLPETHIILFSGQAAAAALIEKAAADGHRFHVLAKPIKPDLLLAAITQFLGRSVSTSTSKMS
jgi:CheY-like chemotaxis protein